MKMLIGDQWTETSETMAVTNPYNGELIDTVPKGTQETMLQAIEWAQQGLKTNRHLPSSKRSAILSQVAHLLKQRTDQFAKIIAQEGSKTMAEATKEVKRAANTIQLSAEEASRLQGETLPFDSAHGSENRIGYYTREPVGIIGAITPYNDPLNLVCHKVGPAIAGGNAIIVRPTSNTPLSALALAELFVEADLPPGILSVVTGPASETAEVLVKDPRVAMISFTGGIETGEKITREAGFKKISMELGSNSPVIVLEDCPWSLAVSSTVSGAFAAVGQNCIGVQRIYIQDTIYESFKADLIEKTQHYRVGSQLEPSTDMGPMINESEAVRVMDWIQEAQDQGGHLLIGGQRQGALVWPTLLENVPEGATLAREEVFGPVALLYPISTLEEGVQKANDVDYGLHAAIFTQNLQHAFYAVRHLDAGTVLVNDSTDYRVDMMPFGGRKKSGLGREGVRYALQEMTEPKVVCFNL